MNIYIRKNNLLLKKILVGVTILFVLIAFLNIFEKQIRNSFYFVSSPVAKVFERTGKNTSVFFESFFNAKNLKQENNNLKEENQKLLSENSLLQDLLEQNQALKNATETAKKNNFQITPVQIIGLDSANDFIIIDKGLEDGISENMPLISDKKVLYGKVFKIYKNFSQVMLISNKNSVLNVKIYPAKSVEGGVMPEIQEKTPIYGALRGGGNLSVYLDLVSPDVEIKQGDILITSALEGIFPKNLLVGKIISKNKNDLKPFQTAEIHPFFDIKNIENLFVITDYLK